MAYWGSGPDECDFAFDSVGVCISMIKERLMEEISTVLDKAYPEQSMVGLLTCLRLLGEHFPKNLSVSFGKRDFARVKENFYRWRAAIGDRVPAKYRQGVIDEAEKEFALFEERILHKKPAV